MQLKPALIVDFRQDGPAADSAPFDPELKETVELFDQDEEVFVFNREEELRQAKELVSRHGYEAEPMNLVLLPPHVERTGHFSDYGFESGAGHLYLYEPGIAVFRLGTGAVQDTDSPMKTASEAEPELAQRQMDEYVIARFHEADGLHFVVDRQHDELMDRTARAYGCTVDFIIS
ncbi:hypothetical protein [Paenibacillus chitinolyticus]|uniref:hypothetical protein n=1 Tax=Paenibacillus chitinolyticus TaxID=79263 RepID=UPI0036261EE6